MIPYQWCCLIFLFIPALSVSVLFESRKNSYCFKDANPPFRGSHKTRAFLFFTKDQIYPQTIFQKDVFSSLGLPLDTLSDAALVC